MAAPRRSDRRAPDALPVRRIAVALTVMAALLLMALLSGLGVLDRDTPPVSSADTANVGRAPALPIAGNPLVEPAEAEAVAVDPVTAIKRNAERPVVGRPNTPARPFRTRLTGEPLERAISCLAIAAIYEAGGDPRDQEPVMQVILNRVRHPAFPASVCQVVFQGSERRTGCQFTFTCDGSLARRRPRDAAFAAARGLAAAMLDKRVDPRVGLATHYHTNYVFPYWSPSLDKVAVIKTHLFFRWPGYWGERSAFRQTPALSEPALMQLAGMDASHRTVEVAGDVVADEMDQAVDATEIAGSAGAGSGGAKPPNAPLRLAVKKGTTPERWTGDAAALCGQRPDCRVVAWAGNAPEGALGAETLAASPPDFVYVRSAGDKVRQAYWKCGRWPRSGTGKCLAGPQDAVRLATR